MFKLNSNSQHLRIQYGTIIQHCPRKKCSVESPADHKCWVNVSILRYSSWLPLLPWGDTLPSYEPFSYLKALSHLGPAIYLPLSVMLFSQTSLTSVLHSYIKSQSKCLPVDEGFFFLLCKCYSLLFYIVLLFLFPSQCLYFVNFFVSLVKFLNITRWLSFNPINSLTCLMYKNQWILFFLSKNISIPPLTYKLKNWSLI